MPSLAEVLRERTQTASTPTTTTTPTGTRTTFTSSAPRPSRAPAIPQFQMPESYRGLSSPGLPTLDSYINRRATTQTSIRSATSNFAELLQRGREFEDSQSGSGSNGDFDFMATGASKFGGFLNKITGGGAGAVWDAVDEPVLAAMTLIDKPRSAVVSTIQETVDLLQGEGFSGEDWLNQIGDNIGFNEVLDDMGVENVWVRRIAGLTGDVFLDPITYIPIVGQAYKAGAITGKGFTLAAARSIDDDVLRGFAKETAAKVSRLGPQVLNADELARMATLDAANQVAVKNAIPVSQVLDSSTWKVADKFANEVAQIPIHPAFEAGVRVVKPGTGRLAQRVRNSRFTPGNKLVRQQTWQIAPQSANRITPGGLYQAAKAKAAKVDRFGIGWLRENAAGEYVPFKKALRRGSDDEVMAAYAGLTAAGQGRGATKRMVVDQMRELVELERRVGGKQNLRHVIPALQSGVESVADLPANVTGSVREALETLGDDGIAAVRKWRDGIREQANLLSGVADDDPFVKYMETWAPMAYAEDFHKWASNPAEGLTPEGSSLLKSIDPEQRVAKIKPGGTYMGEPIYAVTDPKNKLGLTPREQATTIWKTKMADMGTELPTAIFSDDFHESAVASILALGDEVGKAKQLKVLEDFGIVVDLNDRVVADSARTAAKINEQGVALEALQREQSAFRRHADVVSQSIRDRANRLRARAKSIDGKRKPLKESVENAERWQRSVNKVVDNAERSRDAAVKARDDLLLEIRKGGAADVKRLNSLRQELAKTDGKLTKRIGQLEKRRAKALAEVHDLNRRGYKALNGNRKIDNLPDVGKKIRKLRRELTAVNEELDVLRYWMDIDPGDVDMKKATIGAVNEEIADIGERLDTLRTARTPEANRQRTELRARRDELEAIKGDAEDFIRTYEGVLADLPGAEGHTRFVEGLARQDEAIERLEEVFQMENITPQQADQLLRELKSNPNSINAARLRQAEAALGDQADQLADDLARLESFANTPEGLQHPVYGEILVNRRNADNLWGVTEQGPYGPVLTTRTTDISPEEMTARELRDPRTGRKIKEKNMRYQVQAGNPKVYYGGIDDMHFDALEIALTDGLRPTGSWGDGWGEVADMVRSKELGGQGLTLNHAIREVFPYTGSNPKHLVRDLIEDPTTLSGYSRQRMAKQFRAHNTGLGYDSVAYADLATSNWNVVPSDRRAIIGFSSELPEDLGDSLARLAEWQQATVHDNIAYQKKLADQLGGDLEQMSLRREMVGPAAERELDQMIGDVEMQMERALAAADEETIAFLSDRQRGLERARELQAKATEHLDNVKRMADEGLDPLDAQYDALMAEVAQLEAVAAKVEASPIGAARKRQLDKDVRAAEKQLKKLKEMPEAQFNELLQKGEKQVGWNSDRAIPEKIATVLQERSALTQGKLVKHYDTFLKAWRAGATSSPGFHMRNYLGGIINNIHAGIDPAMYGHWGRMQRELDFQMRGGTRRGLRTGRLGDAREASLDPVAAMAETKKALKKKGFSDEMLDAFEQINMSGLAEGGQFDELGIAGATGGRVRGLDRFNSIANPASAKWMPYRGSRYAGGVVENRLRGALALDAMMNGDDIASALNRVNKFHFDYDDLSTVERNKLHRGMAFYTWTRKNLPLQLEMLFDNPRAFQRYLAVQRNIEVGQEEQANLPDWQSRLGRMKLPWGDGIYLNPDMPFSDLSQMVDLRAIAELDPKKFLDTTGRWAINSTAPPIKLGVQALAGQNLFTEAPFEGEVIAVSPTWSGYPGILKAMAQRGLAYKDSDDKWVMPASIHAVATGAFPILATTHRLFPQIGEGNGRREAEHVASSWVSWLFGVGNYVHTPSRQRNVMYGQAFDLKEQADFQRELGFDERAKELDEQADELFDEINELYPRED